MVLYDAIGRERVKKHSILIIVPGFYVLYMIFLDIQTLDEQGQSHVLENKLILKSPLTKLHLSCAVLMSVLLCILDLLPQHPLMIIIPIMTKIPV